MMSDVTTMREQINDVEAYFQGRPITDLVSSQATATPDVVAVASATHVLSYREVDERASALGNMLQGLGVAR